MSVTRYETIYSQTFYNKGVDLGPEDHSERALNAFRQSTVEFARLDPSVGAVQYLNLVGNGVGNQWSIVFSEADFQRNVIRDEKRKSISGKRTRTIQYTLSFKLIQDCRPMLESPSSQPRQIGAKLG